MSGPKIEQAAQHVEIGSAVDDSLVAVMPTKEDILEAVVYLQEKEQEPSVPYVEHGPAIDRLPETKAKIPMNPGLGWPRVRHLFREPIAEFLGTFMILMFGDGVVAQVVLSEDKNGAYQSITWGCKCLCVWRRVSC
jgi:hypothetical protein